MTDFVITENDVAKMEYHNPYGWGADIAEHCRSRTLESELQKERERIYTELHNALKYGGIFALGDALDAMRVSTKVSKL
jgi:hypothetical protein